MDDNMRANLAKANAKRAELRAQGIKPLNPLERALKNPNSLRFAINAFCYECMGYAASWRKDVRNCTANNCPLFIQRPK